MKEYAIFHHQRMVGLADFHDEAEAYAKRLSGRSDANLTTKGVLVTWHGNPTGYRVANYTRGRA